MLCAEILKLNGKINNNEWIYFLRGAPGMDKKRPPKPELKWLSEACWNNACDLKDNLEKFKNLTNDIQETPISITIGDLSVNINPKEAINSSADPLNYQNNISEFERLILIKNFAEDKVVQAVTLFVANNLGKIFVESPEKSENEELIEFQHKEE